MSDAVANAIETIYGGCRFRSRSEARWARFLDSLSVPYEYEKERYGLPGGKAYLPDFWLPVEHRWMEIKGSRPTVEELGKGTQLAEATRFPVHIFWGKVAIDPFWDSHTYPADAWEKVDGFWGGLSIRPACACGYYRLGMHSPYSTWQECRQCGAIGIYNPFLIERDCTACRQEPCICMDERQQDGARNGSLWTPRLLSAYTVARQARFDRSA